ncbi:MAG: TRAP transporter substrate-binding protein [Gammaproteobacteria bacterium]|uniref:TRAP-type mannitol/chloroaromatic compound transport system, substrate-binding protein n=1 Tax=Marinomonas polaris DSM 16579 TaxID=1122206 RepID=A0A1M4YR37_9GAMM|nr:MULTISPECIES: TRAP transporter substrate-binding protein [Marinomonas]MBU1296798.1 TRAP transporter substrate-binding protein [Gammaproteobacteria bacterium]MBU1467653.1 TRAP transporter substrate-binding protein [Gammaproteobacteria bacterium]MBU2020733.1 TRAP transporter substrate-binding protein [Gammaproteobacteria bacterium]MBU2237628.1 TRAP transporter substrate-binding protein [Gammaproteobacteria bacterium]MBU2319014.1 TRAP transporter substrate-binding protein [Gammaproteobacteria 
MKSLKLTTLVAATAVALSAFSLPALAAEKVYKLKMAETWATNFPIFGDAPRNMVRIAEEMSGGRLKITIDSANKHKAPLGVFDMVRSGQYDLGHSASYYWKGKVPNTVYFTTMPFGMTAPEQYGWFYYGDGMKLMEKVYQPFGLLSFPGGNTGVQMGGWFRKEINSVEDLQGLKMRIPGFAGEVLAKLGAKPTNIPPGELYTALERNTIDALEWVGPSLDLRMGFHKIAPYYYTGWHEPATELQFLVNERTWKKLPDDLREILRVAMKVSAYDMYIQSYHESGVNWATMKSEYPDIQVKTFPQPVLNAMKKANDELLTEEAAKDPLAKEIIDSQAAYMKTARVWSNISDRAYLESVDRLDQ